MKKISLLLAHGNIRKIGSNRHFEKIETKAKKWIKNEKYYQIYMETKAWSKGAEI